MTRAGSGPWLAVLLWSCTGSPPPGVGKVWPTRDFFAKPKATFSGFPTARLISIDGGIPWRTEEYESPAAVSDGSRALAVQPAFQNGDVAAYVVTEIWDTHPDPWIQPVYEVHGSSTVNPVFGVGVDSTFYSPFWRVYDAEQTTQNGPFVSVADLVNAKLPLTKGPLWVCPLVPDDVTGFAAAMNDGVPRRPLSGEPVAPLKVLEAWADGALVSFFNFGERQVGELYEGEADGVVLPADLYVFTRAEADGGRTPLELPAVMADEAKLHSYVRRVDVVLQGEAVFVPAKLKLLHDKVVAFLGDAGTVPVDPGVPDDVAAKYTLRVARGTACFADGGVFPQDCTWLDSEGAIDDALPPSRVLDTDVTLTATPVLLGGKSL